MAPKDPNSEQHLTDMKIDIAILKKNNENIKEDIAEVKEEVNGIKGWAQRVFWIIFTAVVIHFVQFVLNGGMNFKIPH